MLPATSQANKARRSRRNRRRGPQPVKPVVLANNASPAPIGNKKKKTKSKRTPSFRVGSHHVRAVCSIHDPFCPAAKGSKWPDGTQSNTFTEQFRGSYTIASSGSGNYVVCFAPTAPFGYLTASAATSTTVTMAAAYTTYRASSLLSTYGSNYRVVSFGVIIRCLASATTASGVLTLGTGDSLTTGTVITLGSELYQDTIVKAIQPGLEISWISQFQGTGSHKFNAVSTATSNNTITPDMSSLIVEIAGCPVSTSMLLAEWYLNVEFLPGAPIHIRGRSR